jgi:adenylate cyclase
VERKLVVILAADVVGYARLMEQDEAGTLAALKQRRTTTLNPLVAAHKGRVVKVMGDGVLIEFGSAVNAVQCAVELQQKMAEANKGLDDDRTIVLRVGVNLGDVVVEASDLYGDGVNIAARLEGIAEPGTVYISGNVFEQVRGKLKFDYEELGPQQLKNIAHPVLTYRVLGTPSSARKNVTDKPSIAVLPFTNMSGDPEQQYFSDGVTEDIITELSRFQSLLVIARNSSFQYRDKAIDVRRIGRELGVQYIVEGSVRRVAARLRVTAQLIDAETGSHIWAEKYDRDQNEIFEVQDEITQAIVGTLPRQLEDAVFDRAQRKPPANLTAYDYFLRAEWLWFHEHGYQEPIALLQKAIQVDPSYARAYARAALIYGYMHGTTGTEEFARQALSFAAKAARLGDGDARVHAYVSAAYLFCGQHDLAEVHSKSAVSLNPNDPEASYRRGLSLVYGGDPKGGLEWLMRATRLDPNMPQTYKEAIFDAHYMAREYDRALEIYRSWPNPFSHVVLEAAACHAQLGRVSDMQNAVEEFIRGRPENFDVVKYVRAHVATCRRLEDREHWIEGYRKTGLLP